MRALTVVAVVGLSFGLGYYVGQRPDEVKQHLQHLSGELIEQTIGLDVDRRLAVERELLEAKASLLEAEIHLLTENRQRATQQLERTLRHLTTALEMDVDGERSAHIRDLRDRVKGLREHMTRGEPLSPQVFDDVQRDIDALRS
ncbi:MAG: hypothetical protein D6690_13935 [Nitrospirae bacterium]|nr:MAG: hypothetical protein D6690_13935 [Nitrospirota bacterium]